MNRQLRLADQRQMARWGSPLRTTNLIASWPRSLLDSSLTAAVLGLQAVPLVRLFVEWLQYVSGGLLYATATGLGYEALSSRVVLAWVIVPIAVAALSPLPRWQERKQVELERARVAYTDQVDIGSGSDGLAIIVEGVDTARALSRRYALPTVYCGLPGLHPSDADRG